MPFIKVYIHFVWSTKNRLPLLSSRTKRISVWNHIRNNARKNHIFLDHINGYNDHCHCLIAMKGTQSMADVMQLIKGESSRWINETNLCGAFFEWQDEYYAASVSPGMLGRVRNYIRNQEEHHKAKSFMDEIGQVNEMILLPSKDGSRGIG